LLVELPTGQFQGPQLHRPRQQRSQGADESLNLHLLRELLFQVLYVAQQVGVTILESAGSAIIAVVAIDYEHAAQAFGAKDLQGHLPGASLTKTENADGLSAKKPGVAVVAIGAPTGLVGVFDQGLPIILHQRLAGPLQQASQLMQGAHQRAITDVQLIFQLPQRHAIDVMLHRYVGQQAIAQQGPGQHARSGRPDQLATTGTILLVQLITDCLPA